MNNNEYRCATCGGIFKKGWSDKRAEEELQNNFGNYDKEDCEIVCDDCYKRMNVNLFIDFKILREEINKQFKKEKIEIEIDGYLIKDYDTLSYYFSKKIKEKLDEMVGRLGNINDIKDYY